MRAYAAATLIAIAGLAGIVAPRPAIAQELQPVPPLSGRVIDRTGTLSSAQSEALAAKLERIETVRGSQVVVLMVAATAPEDIAAYSQRVGEQWKIGRRGIGDGLLIVVAKDERRADIAPAKSLEGAVPDVVAARIIREQMGPAFKAGDFAGGLNQAVDRIDERIAGESLPAGRGERSERTPRGSSAGGSGFSFGDIAIFLFAGVPILGGLLARALGRKGAGLLGGLAVGGIGWWLTASVLVGVGAGLLALFLIGVMGLGTGAGRRGLGPIVWGGGGGFGGGFGSGGGGGGGFSSGGGGDFGGGGASGSW